MRRLSVLLASAVMALTLIAFAVATGASAQQQQQQGKFYSVVFEGDAAFYFGDATSERAAFAASRRKCEAADTNCTARAWVYNGWIVIAAGKNEQGGFEYPMGMSKTKQQATANAMTGCRRPPPLTDCTVIGSHRTVAYDKNKPGGGDEYLPPPPQ